MDIQRLRKTLIAFFEQQSDFVAEMTSDENAPYFDEKTRALLLEMRRTLDRCRNVCEHREATFQEIRTAFDSFRKCVERAGTVALPWIRSMRMPN